ncbi:MAG: DNA mismatch repair endonuclease MutL [Planctomycetes bacterium]|nr:DNA mismatch repair endonuclease MutL [Planctomycetota bacterium]
MGRIRRLSDAVVNQVAAGEVVIQPCSVIKELVENSFDAGASRIEVEFWGSGAEGLRISDNGQGMGREDLALSVQPHATSKISDAADLYSVQSCGFRGEALASIAEVSELEITSSEKTSGEAERLARKGGVFAVEPASRSQGTTIFVKNLFHNVPVRRRFLKSERAEAAANIEVLKRLAMARPWVAFKVRSNDKLSFELPEDQRLEARVRDLGLFDRQTTLLELEGVDGEIAVEGLLLAPPAGFGTAQKIHLYVNHRPFNDRALVHAAAQGCAGHLAERRFPGAVIFIKLQPEEVDVNIHPTKSEVRFREPDRIFRLVQGSVRRALAGTLPAADEGAPTLMSYRRGPGPLRTVPLPAPLMDTGADRQGQDLENRSFFEPPRRDKISSPPPASARESDLSWSPKIQSAPLCEDLAVEDLPATSPRPRVFQLNARFIVIEREGGFEIIDQHAFHERIIYSRLLRAEKEHRQACQLLLMPITLSWPPEPFALEEGDLDPLRAFGFSLSLDSSHRRIEIEGIPDYMDAEKAALTLEELLNEKAEGRVPDGESLRRVLLETLACKAAVKAGEALREEEIAAMVAEAETLGAARGTCPHGRNAVWRISIEEACKKFDR